MPEKSIGVFICQCSNNITSTVDVDALSTTIAALDDVSFVDTHPLLCAADGKMFMAEKLRAHGITHTVVAACSQKEHETTFRRVLDGADRNKYLLQMANIREHVAWVTPDPDAALEKAVALTKAAIRRVARHEPFGEKEIDVNPDVLVIGGGIAGMEAALLAA